MPLKHKVVIGVGIVLGIITITILILVLLHNGKWPVKFSMKVSAPVTVDIYANDMSAFTNQKLIPGKVFYYEINSNNVKNTRTGKTVTRKQLKSIVIHIPNDVPVRFDFGNIPRDRTVILSKDRSGFSILENNTENLRNGLWSKAGYYSVDFKNGIPVV